MVRSKLASTATALALIAGASLALPTMTMAASAKKPAEIGGITKGKSADAKGQLKKRRELVAELPVVREERLGGTRIGEAGLIKKPVLESLDPTRADAKPLKKISGGKKIAKAKEESPAPTRVIAATELLGGIEGDAATRLKRIR